MASRTFVIGPANAILPCCFALAPRMNTPPGAARTMPVKLNNTPITSAWLFALNSAQHLYLCATYLCASSCNRNPIPAVRNVNGSAMINFELSPVIAIANMSETAIHAFTISFIS